MRTDETLRTALLVLVAVLVALALLRPHAGQALADRGSAAGGTIAVASGDHLFLIDTTNKQIAQYTADNVGFNLIGARYYKYDMEIYDKRDSRRASVTDARKLSVRSRKAYEDE